MRTVVDALTKWGPEKGFGRESFTPMYHIYRVLSRWITSIPALNVLDAYFLPGGFVRTLPVQLGPSMLKDARVTALYSTAFLAGWVLGGAGSTTTRLQFPTQPARARSERRSGLGSRPLWRTERQLPAESRQLPHLRQRLSLLDLHVP